MRARKQKKFHEVFMRVVYGALGAGLGTLLTENIVDWVSVSATLLGLLGIVILDLTEMSRLDREV